MPEGRILVTGASGLVGRDCMEYYSKLGYTVTAVSRKPPLQTYGAQFLSVDLSDEDACVKAFSPLTDVVQIVFAALHEEADLVKGWQAKGHIDRNGLMLRNCVEAVLKGAQGLKNITILQGPKAYGVHVHPVRPGAREDRDEDRSIPNFYWAQEDYLKERQIGQPWSWNVLRPALVIGMAVGGAMNLIAAIGVYASVLKLRGESLHFPGKGSVMLEATDTGVIAECAEWCLRSEKSKNQCFNITNGEFMSVKEEWPLIAECFGMKPGEEKPLSFKDDLPQFAEEWDQVREKYGLKAPKLDWFLGQSTQFAEFVFGRVPSAPSAMSCIKVRKAGFNGMLYTDEMLKKWFRKYQEEGLLPPSEGKSEMNKL
ncbi:nucleoside-diphosphate-sugar epimerase [Tothia fuscella]|uniref:Nucleoside-diphosphate-sugar epimerase n=1 Tax=Tothia fuscella TaxID=1048955 RepID=A0A9P4NH23_9PEZI|nr:nucleoside-diphosphate-sugar epimerase [Tothia fuscella]